MDDSTVYVFMGIAFTLFVEAVAIGAVIAYSMVFN